MKTRLRFEPGFFDAGPESGPGKSATRVIVDHESGDPATMVTSEAHARQSPTPWNHSRGKRMFEFSSPVLFFCHACRCWR